MQYNIYIYIHVSRLGMSLNIIIKTYYVYVLTFMLEWVCGVGVVCL